jgi:uncharacterized protein (UPF0332 family)
MNVDDCFRKGLLRRTTPSPGAVEKSLSASQDYIEAARQNMDIGNHGLVLFCAYTSMFHAARAVLFRDGVKERSHACIGIYLAETYGNARELAVLAPLLDTYRMSRHTTLYSLDAEEDEEDARQAIEDAIHFRERIVDFLNG